MEPQFLDRPQRVAYTLYSEPNKCSLNRPLRVYLHMDKDVHKGFNNIESSNTLVTKFFDSNMSFVAWLEMKLLTYKSNVQYYTDLIHPTHWWDYIESDFKSIFGPIVSSIRVLHCHGKYHGNLSNGIAISIPPKPHESVKGLLFGMDSQTKNLSVKALRNRQSDDIKDLIQLIKYASTYPFMRTYPMCQPPSPPSIVHALCLQQLEDRFSSIQLSPQCLRAHWDLNLVVLWNEREMIHFLRMMYMMLFKYASKHLQQTVSSAFVNKDWVKQVKERGAQNVIDVLNRDLNAQKSGMGKLRFYRNCIEHIIPDNGVFNCKETHTTIIEIIPELIPEVVNAAHIMIIDNNFGDYVKVLFSDMAWKR